MALHFAILVWPTILISDIWALWRSVLSVTAPECQKLKNGGLDQYGAEPLEQQQFGTAGVEWVKNAPCRGNTHTHTHCII